MEDQTIKRLDDKIDILKSAHEGRINSVSKDLEEHKKKVEHDKNNFTQGLINMTAGVSTFKGDQKRLGESITRQESTINKLSEAQTSQMSIVMTSYGEIKGLLSSSSSNKDGIKWLLGLLAIVVGVAATKLL